jgi:hypothetical protein
LTTKLDQKHSKILLAGNPFKDIVKNILKSEGIIKLFVAMRDPVWGKQLEVSG